MATIHEELFGGTPKKKPRKKQKNLEKKLSYAIAEYIRYQYPNVIFRFDVAADIKLTMGQGSIVKNKLRHIRGHHDLTIFEARGGFFGLTIELKKNKGEVYRLDGKLKRRWDKNTQSCHNQEQSEHLEAMRSRGYFAEYGFGFELTKKMIDKYMAERMTVIVAQIC